MWGLVRKAAIACTVPRLRKKDPTRVSAFFIALTYPIPTHSRQSRTAFAKTVFVSPLQAPNATNAVPRHSSRRGAARMRRRVRPKLKSVFMRSSFLLRRLLLW